MAVRKNDIQPKELIELARQNELPQIVIDCFEQKLFHFEVTSETLIKRASLCCKQHSELINKLPQDVAMAFIYDYCRAYDIKDVIIENYSYYKGYRDIFYLMHEPNMSGVFIIYNGVSLQKDPNKYTSDFSWGFLDISGEFFEKDIRISGNTTQTAEVILQATFPNDKNKLHLINLFIEDFLIHKTIYQRNSLISKQDILNWYNEINPIKKAGIEYRLTYQQIADAIAVSESSLRSSVSTNKVSKQVERSIELYLKTICLEKELEKSNSIKSILKSWLN